MVRRRRPIRGLTLIEVTLAIALALGLVAGMFAFYREILGTRETLADAMDRIGAVRGIMEQMTEELQCVAAEGGRLRGAETSLRFRKAELPGPAVWVERAFTEDPLPSEQDLRLVGYRLRWEEDEYGYTYVVGLERTCQRLLRARLAEEGVEVERTLLSDRVKFVRFRYWDGYEWMPEPPRGLPRAIEVALGEKPLPEDIEPIDYPFPTVERVVYLPASEVTTDEGQEGGGR